MAVEESTPLLAKTSQQLSEDAQDQQHVDEESGYGGAALSPPPAAPPPPPPGGAPQDQPVNKNNDGNCNCAEEGKQRDNHAAAAGDDGATKSSEGKSSKKKKKQKSSTDSIKSGKTNKTSKSEKKKKKVKDGPQKSCIHLMFDFVRYLAILASTMMFAMQIVPLIVVGYESTWLQIVVRCYLAIFCLSFLLMECRIPLLHKLNGYSWILKGFLYTFIGLIGMEQDLAVKVADIAAGTGTSSVLGPDYATLFATLFMSITTWIMISVGVIYTVLGLLCMQGWCEKLDVEYRTKVKEWKQKKKREEDFRRQKDDYKKYERDRREGRGEWYDDLE